MAHSSTSASGLIIVDEASSYEYARWMQSFHRASTDLDATATKLQADIITLLGKHGMDDRSGGLSGLIMGSDASRVARQIIKPLRAAQADAENIARAGQLFRGRLQNLLWDAIREHEANRTRRAAGGLRSPV